MQMSIFNNLYEWFCSNRLSLNANKTKYIVLRPRHTRDLSHYNIHIGNTQLSRIGNDCLEKISKFLGMHLDENLTWKMHMNEINKKVSRAFIFYKTSEGIYYPWKVSGLYILPSYIRIYHMES